MGLLTKAPVIYTKNVEPVDSYEDYLLVSYPCKNLLIYFLCTFFQTINILGQNNMNGPITLAFNFCF